ncbi:CPBP family intramembrane glutamic endopeptidase [Coleofasciculus sp.]|uniref:CPBP family intramembrane glutamic endopeptidase n=1 Tax=Coleofasciculus sp. TaxID=3100458 RepID=UPI0039FB6582
MYLTNLKRAVSVAVDKLKPELWLLFIAFVIPSLLLYSGFLPRQFLFLTLGGFPTVVMMIYVSINRVAPHKLGLSLELSSVREILPSTLFLLLLGWIFLALLPWFLGSPRSLYLEFGYYGWYFGMSVFQELVWRGFAFLILEKIIGSRERAVILCSASLFAFSHIYFRSVLIVAGTWLLGWLWGKNYWKFRSISGPVVAHYLVGFPFILLNYMGGNQTWSLF